MRVLIKEGDRRRDLETRGGAEEISPGHELLFDAVLRQALVAWAVEEF